MKTKSSTSDSPITLAAALAAVRSHTVPGLTDEPERDRGAEAQVPTEIRRSTWQGWNCGPVAERPWSHSRGGSLDNVAKLAAYNLTEAERAEAQALEDEHFEVQEQIAKHCDRNGLKAEIVEAEAHEGDPFERFEKIEALKRKLDAVDTIHHDLQIRSDSVLNRLSPYAAKVAEGCLELVFEAIAAAEQHRPIASAFWGIGEDQPFWLIYPLKRLRDSLIEAHARFAGRNISGYVAVRYYLAIAGAITPRSAAEHLC